MPFACRKRRRLPAKTSRKSMRQADPVAQYTHLDILNKIQTAGVCPACSRGGFLGVTEPSAHPPRRRGIEAGFLACRRRRPSLRLFFSEQARMNSGPEENLVLGWFLSILVWYAIAFYILGLAKLVPERLQYPFVSGIALISIVYWTGFLAVSLWRRCSVWVGSWQACEHGVRGGKKRGRCLRCRQHEDFRRQEAETHLAEHLLRIEFSRRAGDLAHAQYLRRAELITRSVAMRDLVVKIKRKSPEHLPQFQGVARLAAGSKRLILSTRNRPSKGLLCSENK